MRTAPMTTGRMLLLWWLLRRSARAAWRMCRWKRGRLRSPPPIAIATPRRHIAKTPSRLSGRCPVIVFLDTNERRSAMRIVPMPAPRPGNQANRWLVDRSAPRDRRMALDQALSNGSERERLARLVTQKLEHGTDAEVNGLLRQLTHSASGEQRRGDQLKR